MVPEQRRRLGLRLNLTPEEVDQAAEPTPTDVAAARALWHSAAPPKLAALLDAQPFIEGA